MTHPIIPQTPQQALQRDDLHGRRNPTARLPLTPAQEIARLRAAIQAHRETTQSPHTTRAEHRRAANETLWGHLDPLE